MKRRMFIAGVSGFIAYPLTSAAQSGKVSRVGLILTTSPVSEMAGPEPDNPNVRAFVQELRRLGYQEGQNIILERRSAEGKFERYPSIVAELVDFRADVIVIVGQRPLAFAAKKVTTTVPIVIANTVFDPVKSGLIASLARPGGNITGITANAGPEIEAKRVELLKIVLPQIRRVAFLGMRSDWDDEFGTNIQAAARQLAVTLLRAEHTPNDYTEAFANIIRQSPDAVFVANTPVNFGNRRVIVDFTTERRLPAMYSRREYVERGGLMSYGVHAPDIWRRAAIFVDKILKGAKPADLPIEQPTRFELCINLRTAKTLGLTIPQSLLLRADLVIK